MSMVISASTAVALGGVGLRLARLLVRSGGLETASDWADLVGDATDTQEASTALWSKARRGKSEDAIGSLIAAELSRRLNSTETRPPESNVNLAVAAERVAGLLEALTTDPEALRIASTAPARLLPYALAHGGQTLLDTTEEDAEGFATAVLVESCSAYADLVLRSPAFPAAALQGILSIVRDPEFGLQAQGQALLGLASREEVIDYLRVRILDWDRSPWGATSPPSAIERALSVTTRDRDEQLVSSLVALEGSAGPVPDADIEVAIERASLLVILGGPGSGKSWLSKKYARDSARRALEQLEAGAHLSTVEIPVFTTWSHWSEHSGTPRESLLASSFGAKSGHSALNSEANVERLCRRLLRSGSRVLAIVDSLDEAAILDQQVGRLQSLSNIPDWRVVLSSRLGAWALSSRGLPSLVETARVAHLQSLSYPQDVEGFISRWFRFSPELGQSLILHLRSDRSLALSSTVPLLLTFYCLVAAQGEAGTGKALPVLRNELYDRILDLLLLGSWNGNPARISDHLQANRQVLRNWAMASFTDSRGALGIWQDNFPVQRERVCGDRDSLDNVAPLVDESIWGTFRRTFVHRTLQELSLIHI